MIFYKIRLETQQKINYIYLSDTWQGINRGYNTFIYFIERLDGKAYQSIQLNRRIGLDFYSRDGKMVTSHDIMKYWNFYMFHGHRNDCI
jgi:predicted N-acyltransferase